MARKLKGNDIFLHIPKTGGNWVTKVLEKSKLIEGEIGHKHDDFSRIMVPYFYKRQLWAYVLKRTLGLLSNKKPFMFCFVRHPLAWYESYFKYMSQESRNWCPWMEEKSMKKWHPNAVLNDCGADNFNDFIRNVIRKRPGYVTEMYGWYTTPHVDFVGKQENLTEDLITALKMMKVDFDEEFVRNFPRYGVSDKPKKEIEWDPELKEEVTKLEYAGIVRYGYL